MSAPWLPSLVLVTTFFLTACAPPDRATSVRPPEERPVSPGAPSAVDAVNAGTASSSRAPARSVSAEPMRPAVDPVTGTHESGRPALFRTSGRAGAPAGGTAVALDAGSPRENAERRSARAEVGAANTVGPRGSAGVSLVGATPLLQATAVKSVGANGAGALDASAALPLAVVASAQAQGFSPEQTRVLIKMGEDFLADTAAGSALTLLVPTAGAAPLTAAEIWAASTRASDERFRSMFGYQAFNAMQLQRARDAYAEAKAQQAISTP